MTAVPLERLEERLVTMPARIVACSGGIDSLLLATVAHRASADGTVVAHNVTPAVPAAATARVVERSRAEGWRLELVRSAEFEDEAYLANPVDRCFHCKTHLYTALEELAGRLSLGDGWTLLSGANTDDLGEYRPGLQAAADHGVRHPYIEAGLGKADIRSAARDLGMDFAELPASPCLASRLYTGVRVTPSRLHAIEIGEELVRQLTGVDVVRCRISGGAVLVEVPDDDRDAIHSELLEAISAAMRSVEPSLGAVSLDPKPYRPGRAFRLTPGVVTGPLPTP